MSASKFSRRDALSYRRIAAMRWQAFLKAEFEGEAHVAYYFGVDASTARKWLAGEHVPSGWAVMMAYERAPIEANQHLTRQA